MTKSNRKRSSRKAAKSAIDRPPKPYPDYPLCAANNGYWQKKIKGTICYFGRWGQMRDGKLERIQEDGCWEAALKLFNEQKDDLYAGRKPIKAKADSKGTLRDLCNRFLTYKTALLESGEITAGTFTEYKTTTDRLIRIFGKTQLVDDLTPEDFLGLRSDIAKQWGPVRLCNEITRVRSVFKFGRKTDLIPDEFKKPSRNVLRRERAKSGKRMLEANECRQLIDASPVQPKAMILLGLNAGFGNHDCATLPMDAVDLRKGWIDFPRPKTGIERRCPLWPETLQAMNAVIAERPEPRHEAAEGLVFVKSKAMFGRTWGGPWLTAGIANPVSIAVRDLMKEVGIHRAGIGPYTLRHVFRTVADGTKDFPAVRLIMGHADNSIDAVYREHIDDDRLQAVVDHVHAWLYGQADATAGEKPKLRVVG